ncbi:MAG TPA: DMT family transporter [Vicinamibacteria bacterium]|nr:DMT family transporter [Vicinamibacteria bacterium]
MILAGELAGLGTAALFSASAVLFTLASRRVGSARVNRFRLLVALLIACTVHWVTRGQPAPWELSRSTWMWLAISGVIGLAVGDDLLFRAYVRIGPALSMLVFTLSPVIAALASTIVLGELLLAREWAGIVVTVSGVASVVSQRRRIDVPGEKRSYVAGLLFAFGGAAGQAFGLITAKLGLIEGASAQSGNVIRLLAATASAWIASAILGRVGDTLRAFREDGRASREVVVGAVVGPVAGVWLSLVAIDLAPVGVASTLMSVTPLFLLPIARLVFHEPVTTRAVLGTVVALAGVALLLW